MTNKTDAELQEQISDPFYAKATMNVALADEGDSWTISKKDFNAYTLQLVEMTKARDAAKELDIEEHVNNLNIGHINSGMGIEDLRRVFERRRAEIELRRESDLLRPKGQDNG